MGGFLVSAGEERDALTLQLRSLAAELDGIDRELAEQAWRRDRGSFTATTDLEQRRSTLTAQLRKLAAQLRQFDEQLFSA